MTVSPPSTEMNPSFLNRFMKKFTRDRVVPTISASVSWEIFGMTRCGVCSSPKRASSSRVRASRFSAELNSWSMRSSSMRTFLVSRCAMNPSDISCSSCSSRRMSALLTATMVHGV